MLLFSNWKKHTENMIIFFIDPTVKVAALIVMEFLLSGNEITNEISDCVGLFKLSGEENRRIHDFGEDEV